MFYFDSLVKMSRTKIESAGKKDWSLKVSAVENKMEWNFLGIESSKSSTPFGQSMDLSQSTVFRYERNEK